MNGQGEVGKGFCLIFFVCAHISLPQKTERSTSLAAARSRWDCEFPITGERREANLREEDQR